MNLRLITPPLLAAPALAACVTANTVRLGPSDARYSPIPWERVAVYASQEDVPGDYLKIGLIHAEGPSDWTRQSGIVKRMQQEAGRIGAHAVVLGDIDEPSAGEKIAANVFAMSAERTAVATAIRFVDDAHAFAPDAVEIAAASEPDTDAGQEPPALVVARRTEASSEGAPQSRRRQTRWGDRYWSQPAPNVEGLPPPAEGWVRLLEWEGDSFIQTESFEVPPGEWRLVWVTWGPGKLGLRLFDLPDGGIVARMDQENEVGASSLRLDSGGTFYLRIEPEGVAWRVGIDVAR